MCLSTKEGTSDGVLNLSTLHCRLHASMCMCVLAGMHVYILCMYHHSVCPDSIPHTIRSINGSIIVLLNHN